MICKKKMLFSWFYGFNLATIKNKAGKTVESS